MANIKLVGILPCTALILTACSNAHVQEAYELLDKDRAKVESIAAIEDVTAYCDEEITPFEVELKKIDASWRQASPLSRRHIMELVKEGKKDEFEDRADALRDEIDIIEDEIDQKLKEQC